MTSRNDLLNIIKELSDDLAQHIDAAIPARETYPSQMRRYERDMDPVYRARAVLLAEKQAE